MQEFNYWKEANKVIPGGTQVYSKQPDLYLPDKWPTHYKYAQGVEIVTSDYKHFIDMASMGLGSCILGYANKEVNDSVKYAIDNGNMCALNSEYEISLAYKILEEHPWAKKIRYAKTGGEAVAIAIRIARAYNKGDNIAVCGYHGWHDWYLAANLNSGNALDEHLLTGLDSLGVPNALKGTTFALNYGDINKFKELIKNHLIRVLVMEPFRTTQPNIEFLKEIKEICSDKNIILIFDEITSGYREKNSGVHMRLNIHPDIAVFGKAISNGYPFSTIIGRDDIMKESINSFISSTYWSDSIGMIAAARTIDILKTPIYQATINYNSNCLAYGIAEIQSDNEILFPINNFIKPIISINFNIFSDFNLGLACKTYFTQEMLKENILANGTTYFSYAHTSNHIIKYLEKAKNIFEEINCILKDGSIYSKIGKMPKVGFKRLV